jgi:hypothetical protein
MEKALNCAWRLTRMKRSLLTRGLFHAPRVALRAEGKRLARSYSTQRELNRALAGARSVLVTAELRKA